LVICPTGKFLACASLFVVIPDDAKQLSTMCNSKVRIR
jgi:hypothetical protein